LITLTDDLDQVVLDINASMSQQMDTLKEANLKDTKYYKNISKFVKKQKKAMKKS